MRWGVREYRVMGDRGVAGEESLTTVNVVIFTGGNFRENVVETFHVGVNFHDKTPI